MIKVAPKTDKVDPKTDNKAISNNRYDKVTEDDP